jgi:hypothetical protein
LIATIERGCSRFVRPAGWSDRVSAGGEWRWFSAYPLETVPGSGSPHPAGRR